MLTPLDILQNSTHVVHFTITLFLPFLLDVNGPSSSPRLGVCPLHVSSINNKRVATYNKSQEPLESIRIGSFRSNHAFPVWPILSNDIFHIGIVANGVGHL
jgi:hypothetical protein